MCTTRIVKIAHLATLLDGGSITLLSTVMSVHPFLRHWVHKFAPKNDSAKTGLDINKWGGDLLETGKKRNLMGKNLKQICPFLLSFKSLSASRFVKHLSQGPSPSSLWLSARKEFEREVRKKNTQRNTHTHYAFPYDQGMQIPWLLLTGCLRKKTLA